MMKTTLPTLTVSIAALVACTGAFAATATVNAPSAAAPAPANAKAAPPATKPSPAPVGALVGPSCKGGDANHICLALKYVAYDDGTGKPVASQADALTNLQTINKEWAQCDIGFQIEEYDAITPKDYGFNFSPANTDELDPIRTQLSNDHTMLVVTTGTWDRSGSLGDTGANAWTNMPGDGVYGSILEQPVATFALIPAHELGHYMGLVHVADTSDLMNPIIGDTSTTLTPDQCSTARATIPQFWNAMKR